MSYASKLTTFGASALLATAVAVASAPAQAERINSAQLISRSLDAFLNCASWDLTGGCVWYRWKCGWTGCRLKLTTTLKVEHYVPDVTFQTYKNAQETPWKETGAILAGAQAEYDGSIISTILSAMGSGVDELGGGGGTESKAASHSNMTFNLVDAFGNPANSVLGQFASFSPIGGVCKSRLSAYYPYYISNLDTVAWRFGVPEMIYLESLNPFGSLLGTQDFNYGGFYPRVGHSTNHDELKESALTTFRAAHFVSRRSQAHIYTTISSEDNVNRRKKEGYHGLKTGDQGAISLTAGKWQQVSPAAETSCNYMPLPISSINPTDGKSNYRSDDGHYVWNLWRRYECCKKPSGWSYWLHF